MNYEQPTRKRVRKFAIPDLHDDSPLTVGELTAQLRAKKLHFMARAGLRADSTSWMPSVPDAMAYALGIAYAQAVLQLFARHAAHIANRQGRPVLTLNGWILPCDDRNASYRERMATVPVMTWRDLSQ